MTARADRRYELRWRRANLAALLALCCLWGAMLAAGRPWRNVWYDAAVPVSLARVESARQRVDPNVAGASLLRCLPGIGPAKAQAVIEYRNAHGAAAFRQAEDLARVRGIGPGTVERVRPYLAFTGAEEPSATRPGPP